MKLRKTKAERDLDADFVCEGGELKPDEIRGYVYDIDALEARLQRAEALLQAAGEQLGGLWGQLRTQEDEPGWPIIDDLRAFLAEK